ncbi:MAG: DUF4124 domain-containing protein [Methylococcales bacterium]|nr:DUF4124 domain-containing protein [Methylococcales bacterium]
MRLTVFILGSLFSIYASAGVYKCKDANGNTTYGSNPCEAGVDTVKIDVRTGSAIDLDKQARELEAAEKAKEAALEKQKLDQEASIKKQQAINSEAVIESGKNQLLIKTNPDKYSAYAIPPYSPDKLPELVKPHRARIAEIERLRRKAAETALASDQCKRVESVELHSNSSATTLVFYITCSSGKSFFFNDKELSK